MATQRKTAKPKAAPVGERALHAAQVKYETASLKFKTAKLDAAHKFFQNTNVTSSRKRKSGAQTPDIPQRDMTARDRSSALAKARQKAEESALASGIITTLVDNVIGSGFTLQSQTGNDDFNNEIERRWRLWTQHCDIRGVRTFGEMQRAFQYRKIVDGDVGIMLLKSGKIQGIEADRIRTTTDQKPTKKTNTISEGVELDAFGAPQYYYVAPRKKDMSDAANAGKKGKRTDARNFIHIAHFPHERFERVRGVSMLLQNLNNFEDFEQIFDGILQKVKNEAFAGFKWTTTPTDSGEFFKIGAEADSNAEAKDIEDEAGVKRPQLKMVPGTNIHLEENEDVEVMESKAPGSNFEPFIMLFIRTMGTGFGMPLEMILLDFSKTNYSSARASLEQARKRFRVEQGDAASKATRIYQWWLSREIKNEADPLEVPAAVEGEQWRHRWVKPAWPYLNPAVEVQAQQAALDAGITTRRDIIEASSGEDWQEIFRQLQAEYALASELGIPLVVGQPGSSTVDDKGTPNTDKDDEEVKED